MGEYMINKQTGEIEIMLEANLAIEVCKKGTPERNAIMLCLQIDYAFIYQGLPMPWEMFKHLTTCQSAGIVRL
jgi:hypothetical protein